jgi:hypothetical protein
VSNKDKNFLRIQEDQNADIDSLEDDRLNTVPDELMAVPQKPTYQMKLDVINAISLVNGLRGLTEHSSPR